MYVVIVVLEVTAPVLEVQHVSVVCLGIMFQHGMQLHVKHAVQECSHQPQICGFAYFVHQASLALHMGRAPVLIAQMVCIA